MTRDEALAALKAIKDDRYHDEEVDHSKADDILLDLIADDEIRQAWESIDKWYA